jgi:hypothetical protein
MTGCFEHCNEPRGSIKGGKFFDFLKKILAPQEKSVI